MKLRDKDNSVAEICSQGNPNYKDNVIFNWIENPKPVEFDGIRMQAEMEFRA